MDRELALLNRAARQEGLIKRAEALKLMSARQLRWRMHKKRWRELKPGVFLVSGVPQTHAQELRALTIWLRRGFALSHETAARLHRFRGYAEATQLVVTVNRRVRKQPGLKVFRSKLPKSDVGKLGDLLVTTIERTVIDLEQREENLRALVDDLLSRKKTTLDRLEIALRRLDPGGRSALWKLIDAYRGSDAPTESELERLVVELLEKAELPLPRKQKVLLIAGRLRRVDFIWQAFGVVLEVDGYLTHSSPDAFEDDRERQNALMERGLVVLRWTWNVVKHRPEALLTQLRALLMSRAAGVSELVVQK